MDEKTKEILKDLTKVINIILTSNLPKKTLILLETILTEVQFYIEDLKK